MIKEHDILRMAREAGFGVGHAEAAGDLFAHFAALVASAEREACAKVADATFRGRPGQAVNLAVADAIRARGAA